MVYYYSGRYYLLFPPQFTPCPWPFVLCLCCKQDAKYKCPRCSVPYCCVSCYKSHGQCSEDFYQGQVKETLQSTVASEAQRKATIEMLERLNIQEMEEEDEEIEHDRVHRIEMIYQRLQEGQNPDDVWLSLQESERHEFWNVMESGELSCQLLEQQNGVHVPWYCDPISNGLIEDVDNKLDSTRLPASIPSTIPIITTLIPGGVVPEQLAYNYVEIVFVYCFCFRLYAGDWNSDIDIDIIETMLRISRVLNPVASSFQAFPSTGEAISSSLSLSILPPFTNTRMFSVEVINDVVSVLRFKNRSLLLLSHLYTFFSDIMNAQTVGSTARKRITKMRHKIWFYLSWCDTQDAQHFETLKEELIPLYSHYYNLYFDTETTLKSPPGILAKTSVVITSQVPPEVVNDKVNKKKPLIIELN